MDLSIVELEEILRWSAYAEDEGCDIDRVLWSKLKDELNNLESY